LDNISTAHDNDSFIDMKDIKLEKHISSPNHSEKSELYKTDSNTKSPQNRISELKKLALTVG